MNMQQDNDDDKNMTWGVMFDKLALHVSYIPNIN